MLSVIEFLLIVSDCFGFMLEPLVRRLQLLSYILIGALPHWIERQSRDEITFEAELREFYNLHKEKSYKYCISHDDISENVFELASRAIRTKWPRVLVQQVGDDPSVQLMDWIDCDLVLIDDWDFPPLFPDLSPLLHSFLEKPEAERGFQLSKGWISVDNTDRNEMRLVRSRSTGPRAFNRKVYLHRPATGVRREGSDTMRVSDQESELSDGCLICEQKPILRIKWITTSEFLLHQERSNLVFYYTQRNPELASLFLIVSHLLEAANLIQSTCQSSISSTDSGYPDRKQFLSVTRFAAPSCYDHPAANSLPLLDRYALILMLVAYLNSAQVNLRAGGNSSLANLLIGFFVFYSTTMEEVTSLNSLDCIYIRPTLKRVGELEVGLEKASIMRERMKLGRAAKPGKLVLLDPVAEVAARVKDRRTYKLTAVDSITHENMDHRLFNLTQDLKPELLHNIAVLFRDLSDHLNASGPDHLVGQGSAGTFATLIGLSLRRSDRSQVAGVEEDEVRLAEAEANESRLRFHSEAGGSRVDLMLERRHELVRTSSNQKMAPLQSYLSSRRFLVNLLYLVLFLLIRNLALNYLDRVSRNLRDQSRDDLIQLKNIIFSNANDERDWKSDPIHEQNEVSDDESLDWTKNHSYDQPTDEEQDRINYSEQESEEAESTDEAFKIGELLELDGLMGSILMHALSGESGSNDNMDQILAILLGGNTFENLVQDEQSPDESKMETSKLVEMLKSQLSELASDVLASDKAGADSVEANVDSSSSEQATDAGQVRVEL